MIDMVIGRDDATTVCGLLHDIGRGSGGPPELRNAAIYWAAEVGPDMERGDLQTVAWLLRDASASGQVPQVRRDQARYWAAYLEGRMVR